MKLKEEEYNSIIVLINYGFSQKEIEEKTGRGHATIQRIKKSMKDGTGYEGYKEYIKYHYRKKDDEIINDPVHPSGYKNLDELLADAEMYLHMFNDAIIGFINREKEKRNDSTDQHL